MSSFPNKPVVPEGHPDLSPGFQSGATPDDRLPIQHGTDHQPPETWSAGTSSATGSTVQSNRFASSRGISPLRLSPPGKRASPAPHFRLLDSSPARLM